VVGDGSFFSRSKDEDDVEILFDSPYVKLKEKEKKREERGDEREREERGDYL
jgi:hypothetical protein